MLTHPLFLIGLSAIAIPIIIHLLQLRRYRKVYFSNVDMLDELQSENRRQHNLRKLLILASRILPCETIATAEAPEGRSDGGPDRGDPAEARRGQGGRTAALGGEVMT